MFKLALFDYESAGAGISKNAPRKKGISLFFDIFFRKFWKLLEVNLLYSLFFVPLILAVAAIVFLPEISVALSLVCAGICVLIFMLTIGPATVGVMKIMRCYLIEKHTFIIRDFFRAFKRGYAKSAVIGFADCIVVLSVYASLKVYPMMADTYNTKLFYVPMTITFSIAIVVLMMNYFIFLMIAATNLSLKNLVKNSFALAFISLKGNLIIIITSIVTAFLMLLVFIYLNPLFWILLPFFPASFLLFVTAFNSYPVIQKYVINPYYTSIGEINPELLNGSEEETIFEDMGGKEAPIEKRKKGKAKKIS